MRVWMVGLLAALGGPAHGEEPVLGFLDWQGHPAMHVTWGFFPPGLTDRERRLRWRHQFRQTVSAPSLEASGVRLFLPAAMAAERARDREHAWALVEEGLAYVEAFAEAHPDRFAMASTPAEARRLLTTTDKMVLVHSIEGGHLLLRDAADAQHWADRGVALVTLVHLRDDELGGSAIDPTFIATVINKAGTRARRSGDRRGLTERGAEAIVELADAGVLVDLSHMSPETFADALEVTAAHGIPPVLTHGKLARIQDTERGISDGQLVEVYRQGGSFNLGLSGRSLGPRDPTISLDTATCWGTLDAFAVHYRHANHVLAGNLPTVFDTPGLAADALSVDQQIALAVGWSSDWNGWVSHSAPKHRGGGCDAPEPDTLLEIDTWGLAHPGLLPQHWQRLAEDGVDLEPIRRSPEQFLRLWEQAHARAGRTQALE
ncbi:MAG: microsomal dipeptidase-like Zn-dependent dipeptidase [Myxococcota bacterium]|jgi:microsomal dipeptidase-like Zn-dependent dipeptidase